MKKEICDECGEKVAQYKEKSTGRFLCEDCADEIIDDLLEAHREELFNEEFEEVKNE